MDNSDNNSTHSLPSWLRWQWVWCLPAIAVLARVISRHELWKPVWRQGKGGGGSFAVPAHEYLLATVALVILNVALSSATIRELLMKVIPSSGDLDSSLGINMMRIMAFVAINYMAYSSY
jgi:hypothetical protein